ncbi:hypothetical protein NRIC_30330 [Enterococcus florum]|uniref:Rhodanese domain-containing protein n=1 Tax=Enterococcus florum TaxID=2480627 RepID=A0A4P5PHL8_9ENTE|nr:rhodanese-like domain-containing protein [Enterococcus florum]GCF95142.1 hypothetical protein NRIC_30330 [Enterococcus florum]
MIEAITAQTFQERIEREDVHLLDLRDPELFDASQYVGKATVTQLTVTQLPNRLSELKRDKKYYLLTHFNDQAKTVANFLHRKGYRTAYLIGSEPLIQEGS